MENDLHGGKIFGSVFVSAVQNDSEMASAVWEHFLISVVDEHKEALSLRDSIDGRRIKYLIDGIGGLSEDFIIFMKVFDVKLSSEHLEVELFFNVGFHFFLERK